MSESILTSLAKSGISIDKLEREASKYFFPLVHIIKESPKICLKAKHAWEYKSLAQFALEVFCSKEAFFIYESNEQILNLIAMQFSQCLKELIWYNKEGLRFYIRKGSKFKLASLEDEDYKFVSRLEDEGILNDIVYYEPPIWAQNLYLNFRAYEVYGWFYHSDFENSKFDLRKRLTSDAIAKILDEETVDSISISRNIANKERETLLIIIAALSKEAKIDISKTSKSGELIAAITQQLGTPIGATTIETHLKKIPQALESRTK